LPTNQIEASQLGGLACWLEIQECIDITLQAHPCGSREVLRIDDLLTRIVVVLHKLQNVAGWGEGGAQAHEA
jgi:hypothetical protein